MWMRMRANHPRGTRTNQLRLLWVELSLSRNYDTAGKQHGRGSATAHAHGMAQSYYTCKILSHQFFENLSSQNAWKDAVYKNAEEILAILLSIIRLQQCRDSANFYGAFASDR